MAKQQSFPTAKLEKFAKVRGLHVQHIVNNSQKYHTVLIVLGEPGTSRPHATIQFPRSEFPVSYTPTVENLTWAALKWWVNNPDNEIEAIKVLSAMLYPLFVAMINEVN